MFDYSLRESFLLIIVISGIPLAATTLASFLVGVLQAATQIQEQTLSHVVKFLAVSAVLLVCGGWFTALLLQFFRQIYESFAFV